MSIGINSRADRVGLTADSLKPLANNRQLTAPYVYFFSATLSLKGSMDLAGVKRII